MSTPSPTSSGAPQEPDEATPGSHDHADSEGRRSPAPTQKPSRRAGRGVGSRASWAETARRFEVAGGTRERLAALGATLVVGVGLLVLRSLEIGPEWLGSLGATLVCAGYAWALAARLDGRPAVAALAALGLGGVVTVVGSEVLRGGAAVLATVLSGVLAVVVTVPATHYLKAVREVLFAVAVASLGAVAVVGFDPAMDRTRYVYLSLALGMAGMLLIVFRLGAGLAGLGRRGLVVLVGGCLLMLLTAGYFDLIKSYGSGSLTQFMIDVVAWFRDSLGAFPRLMICIVGVPALAWGVHMRARRRQGWWVCAFGVAGTMAVAQMFTNPTKTFEESLLSSGYGVLLGLVIGYVLVRIDLAVTGTRGSRSRRDEEAAAVRPEPGRTHAL